MPFTLAHPAAVVPFQKHQLPLSALVIGSMAPDFPYFLHGATDSRYGHSWAGLFLFCVPAGYFVLWTFHRVLKLPLLWLLAVAHQIRLVAICGSFDFSPWQRSLRIGLALLLGACTHLVWDSFTHASGWPVQHSLLLRSPIIEIPQGTLFFFKALQHGSTLLGLSLLIFCYLQWFKRAPIQNLNFAAALPNKLRLLLLMSLIASLIAGFYALLSINSFAGTGWLQPFAHVFVVRGVAILLLEILIFSGFWHLQNSHKSAG